MDFSVPPQDIAWVRCSGSLAQSIGVFAGIAYGIVVIMALLLPETRGRELTPD